MSEGRRHNREWEGDRQLAEMISAYLDDRESLSTEEQAQIAALLADDPEARQIHAELGVIRQELRNLEPIAAPRPYHLTAEMVGAPEPVKLQESTAWYARHTETVRWATAAAAVIFVFVLGADLILHGVFSEPDGGNSTVQTDQADVMSRQAGDDDSAGSAAGDTELEAISGDGGDDADAGEEAPPVPTPELAQDTAGGGENADEAEEEAEDAPDPAAIAPPADDGEEPETGESGDAAESGDSTDSAAIATEEASIADADLFYDAEESATDDGSPDRQWWRIAEFSLVVLLGLLLTAMVVLPRLGRNAARTTDNQAG